MLAMASSKRLRGKIIPRVLAPVPVANAALQPSRVADVAKDLDQHRRQYRLVREQNAGQTWYEFLAVVVTKEKSRMFG